ncbi:hypothetical protein ES703_65774 [subsurface metagenome]
MTLEINLTLVTGFKEAGKDPNVKCRCGKLATHQLEEEHDQIANPIGYYCPEDAEKLSKKYGIPTQEVVFKEGKEG